MAKKKGNSFIDKKDIFAIFNLVLQNWYIFIFCFGIALLYANIKIHKTPSIYRVSTSVLLKTEQGNLTDALIRGLGINKKYEDVANELRIIKSTEVISKTLEKLDFGVSYFIIGRLSTKEVFGSTPFHIQMEVLNSNFYGNQFLIDIVDRNRFIVRYNIGEVPQTPIKGRFGVPFKNRSFSFLVSKNPNFNDNNISDYREIQYAFVPQSKNALIAKYKGAITVKDIDWTSIIEISLNEAIPERGAIFLDTLARIYIESSIEAARQTNDRTIEFIDKMMLDMLGRLGDIESEKVKFRQENEGFDITVANDKQNQRLLHIQTKLEDTKVQLEAIRGISGYLKGLNDTDLTPPPLRHSSMVKDAHINRSLNELLAFREKLVFSLINRKKDNIDYKIDAIQFSTRLNSLMDYMDSSVVNLMDSMLYFKNEQLKYDRLNSDLPIVEHRFMELERQYQVNEKMYSFLLEKKSNAIIQRASILPDKKVIERAKGGGLVSPNKEKILNSALGIAAIISISLVFLRRMFFESIESLEDLQKVVDVPVIGVVTRDRDGRSTYLIVENKPRSFVSESFRSIRNNLEYLPADSENKVILVTSSTMGEGKTFTSINLATIYAKAGKKTIVLEFDLHKPKVQKAFNMSNEIGITSILSGKAKLEDCIKNSPIEFLDVLVSGPIPPNSSELILSKLMHGLFAELREKYEYIIMDSPPVGVISDALILMKFSDINLFVLRANLAKPSVGEQISNIRDNFHPKNFGLILNGVKSPGGIRYGKYGSRYGYGYGYGPYSGGYGPYGGYGPTGN